MDSNDPQAFERLALTKQAQLLEWIRTWLTPGVSGPRRSSYYLKHIFESDGGFYVANGEFKGALLAAGMTPLRTEPNWAFRVKWNRACQGHTIRGEACLRPAKLGQDFCTWHISERRGGYHRWIG